ncbi:MAG: hypothetical protein ACRYG8_41585 [Janthinobacterium lividum]
MTATRAHWLFLPVLVQLAGCDPFRQSGTWHATGINQANLDTQAVDKADTVTGHGTAGSDAVLDVAAVVRLHEDKTKALRVETTTGGSS